MKKAKLCILSVMGLLVGCGGSGGGGAELPPPAPIALHEYQIFSTPPSNVTGSTIEQDGNPDNPYDDYIYIRRDGNDIVFTYRDVNNLDLLGNQDSMRSFAVSTGDSLAASDFKKSQSDKYLRAEKNSSQIIKHNAPAGAVDGTFEVTEVIEVGGKMLGLDYADFGMWKTTTKFSGKIDGNDAPRSLMLEPELWNGKMQDKEHEAYFEEGRTGTVGFTGNAMGVARAHNGGDDAAAPLYTEVYGSATMDIDLSTRQASLLLEFDKFYNFQFNKLGLDQRGEIEEISGVSTLDVTDTANNTVIKLEAGQPRFDVDMQLYGPTRTDPTEAVGEVEIEQLKSGTGDNRYIEIDIAFGMKTP